MGNVKIDESESYINPYNFITLNKTGCKRENKENRKGNLTGFIECTLTTKTETMILDTREEKIVRENINDGDFKSYVFNSYDEKINGTNIVSPVIPGSELRGMIRNDFEIFTDSCLSTIDKDKSFISRSRDVKNPGILKKDENGKWHLYKATRYALHTTRKGKGYSKKADNKFAAIYMVNNKNRILQNENKNVLEEGVNELKTGDRVRFSALEKENNQKFKVELNMAVKEITKKGTKEGILFIGELGGKKDKNSIHDSIFCFNENDEISNVVDLEKSVKKLKEIYEVYNDKALNKLNKTDKIWYDGYDLEKASELPVWYSNLDNQNRTYLSLAAIGKEAYHRKMNELLSVTEDKEKSYMPCINRESLCETCDLFGFVSDDDAKGGKIRVSDAIYIGNDVPYAKKRIIKELSTPHIANAAFYSLYLTNKDLLEKQENIDWNYDFEFSRNSAGKIIAKKIDADKITIRGRKCYWHHKPCSDSLTNEKTIRNCAITPVKENSKFKFKIYFENIKEEYLKDLMAVINLKYDSNIKFNEKPYYDLCHKIGMAKPFGYGSVKINLYNVKIREINFNNNSIKYNMIDYLKEEINNIKLNDRFNMESEAMQDVIRIYNFNYLNANYPESKVTYPLSSHPSSRNVPIASHYWFMDNKSSNIKNPYILMCLPQIKDGSEKPLNIKGLNEKENKRVIRMGNIAKINGLKLPKYKKA